LFYLNARFAQDAKIAEYIDLLPFWRLSRRVKEILILCVLCDLNDPESRMAGSKGSGR